MLSCLQWQRDSRIRSTGCSRLTESEALALVPESLQRRQGLQVVLHRSTRQLMVFDQGELRA